MTTWSHQLHPICNRKPSLMLSIRALLLLEIIYTGSENNKQNITQYYKINTFLAQPRIEMQVFLDFYFKPLCLRHLKILRILSILGLLYNPHSSLLEQKSETILISSHYCDIWVEIFRKVKRKRNIIWMWFDHRISVFDDDVFHLNMLILYIYI